MKHKRNSILARLNIVRRWKLGEIDRDQARAELDRLRGRPRPQELRCTS